jgi:thymidylate synthase (FAD)
MGDDLRVVNAARISYGKTVDLFTEKDRGLINYLAKNRHMSPFEHNILSVVVECPLFIRSQIHRHRTFSYNEVSRRYTSDGIAFYMYPEDDVRAQSKTNKQGSEGVVSPEMAQAFVSTLTAWLDEGQKLYDQFVIEGIAREQARSFLGVNLMTQFYMTGNLRNWVHFLNLRLDEHAQKESRIVAADIEKIIIQYWPISYRALVEHGA